MTQYDFKTFEPISIDLLQEVLDNFPDKNCNLICFTIKSEINGYEYTFSRVNNCWKCTLKFNYSNRAPTSFDAKTLQIAIDRAEMLSGCPDDKKLEGIDDAKAFKILKSSIPIEILKNSAQIIINELSCHFNNKKITPIK